MFPLVLFSGFITCTLCVQYIFVNENKTWTEAQSYCRDKYSDLVTVETEQETLQLLNMMDDYNSSDLAWIGLYDDLNSWKWTLEDSDFFSQGQKQFRNWNKEETVNYGGQSLCVYMYRGIWETTNCDNRRTFICYDGRQNASTSYVWVNQNKNWIEAQSYCREHHTDLVSIRNETENQKTQYLIKDYYNYSDHSDYYYYFYDYYYGVWIGLYRTRSWSDQSNSTFSNWRSGEPNNAGEREYCTAVTFSDSTWTDENCNNALPFLCYNGSSLASSRQYHFISVNKSWSEAQTYCRQNYIDLATITNMTEMNSVMDTGNGTYNGLAWIGLYDDVNSWRWSLEDDGFYQEGEREFRNWYHEPDNYGGNELCVLMFYVGSWFDLSCDSTLPFVCFNRNSTTQSYIRISESRSWTEAQSYCRQYHTDLANVRNLTENQKIFEISGGEPVWIGLYRNRIWSNGQTTKYQNWKPGTPQSYTQPDNGYSVNGQLGNQHCTAVSFRDYGRWTDENCLSNMPFICYSRNCTQSSCSPRQYHFISVNKSWSEAQTYCRQNYIDLATITNMTEMNKLIKTVRGTYNGSAWIGLYDDVNSWRWSLNTEVREGFNIWNVEQPRNWGGQSFCVSLSYYRGLWNEQLCSSLIPFVCYDGRQNASASFVVVYNYVNWTEAQSYCREHHTELVSIRNATENQNIRSVLQNNGSVWIGLYRTRSWSDQSNSTFSNWRSGEPNNAGNSEYCTAVTFSDSTWTDENCDYQLPFICYSGSSLASSPHYYFISVNKSWSEAQTYCRQNYIDLATITNMTEMNSVMDTGNGTYNGSAWIGLYDDVNSWRWSLEDDGFYQEGEREFRNWNHQPDNYRGKELCVYMSNDGSWYDESCENNMPFVCYDGRGNTSQRYIFVDQDQSWSEAQRYCREFYTDLAIMRNETEHQQILNITHSSGYYYNVWIGLYRNRLWSDQSNSSFTYWLPQTSYVPAQPDNGLYVSRLQGAQHCTAVSLQSYGQWTDENCVERLPFFCYGDQYVAELQVKFKSQYNLSKSQIEEQVLKQLQETFKRLGLPSNFTISLRNYRKISP